MTDQCILWVKRIQIDYLIYKKWRIVKKIKKSVDEKKISLKMHIVR